MALTIVGDCDICTYSVGEDEAGREFHDVLGTHPGAQTLSANLDEDHEPLLNPLQFES